MDAQTLQTLISLAILIFGIFSIWLNWRKDIPPQDLDSRNAWRELYQQSHVERTRNERENEQEIVALMTKIAVQARELEILRAELALRQNAGISVNTNVIGREASVGQAVAGTENTQTQAK